MSASPMAGGLPDPAFWAGRRVLLTGHTGFKGAWAALWLHALGARVHGFSDGPLPGRSLYADAGPLPLASDGRGDIRDAAATREAVARREPEVVIHLAAQSLVRASYAEPAATFAANLMGTVHLLEAVRGLGGACPVIVVTSDKCYENRETGRAHVEGDPLGGHDPYSASKACAEIAALAYARSFGAAGRLRVATARAGNVVGGGDWAADRLVPDLARGLMAGRPVPIRNPGAVRPWQHVLEPLCGYLLLAERAATGEGASGESGPVSGEAWNFGPDAGSEATVGTVAETFCRLWGRPEGWQAVPEPGAPHEAHLLHLESAKARARLGWAPRWDLDQALAASVALYRADLSGADLRRLALGQIADYTNHPASPVGGAVAQARPSTARLTA
ncbi:CDP-glucose 4,6-dehydratase [Methylobacterium dankookense]|nr:CDP-glucose 4,6-dehydratase [Methylobacterium dankookense]